jgi:hypothetical protein
MIGDCGFLIDDVTGRLAIATSHFKNQQPSIINHLAEIKGDNL